MGVNGDVIIRSSSYNWESIGDLPSNYNLIIQIRAGNNLKT